MVKIVWTGRAIHDLDEIGVYIARDSERYVKMVIQNLFESAGFLENDPRMGAVVAEFKNSNIRELVRGTYRIVYHIVDRVRIDILTVHHAGNLFSKPV